MEKPRKRITIALLMLLIMLAAFTFKAVEYSRRIRVDFANRGTTELRNVTVSYAGRVEKIGAVGANGRTQLRVPASPSTPIRIAWDVPGTPGEPDRHVEAPALTASYGGSVEVSVGP